MRRALRSALIKLPNFITCREFEQFTQDYLDGNLPLLNRIRTYLHLLICRDCRHYIEAYRKSILMGRAFFDNPDALVPQDIPEELIAIIIQNMKK